MKRLKFIIFSLFILFVSCNSSTENLPVLSYTIDDSGKKNYYKISYEGFTNQLGNPFTSEDIKGKICVTNFFFTRCPSICPPMRTELISIAESFSDDKNLMLISHTIDPKHDSIPILWNYAEATGISSKRWQFLRATETQTKAQANQFMTNFEPNEDGTDFYHSSYVALVDSTQQIRGFYNILVKEDSERLKTDIHQLLNQ